MRFVRVVFKCKYPGTTPLFVYSAVSKKIKQEGMSVTRHVFLFYDFYNVNYRSINRLIANSIEG